MLWSGIEPKQKVSLFLACSKMEILEELFLTSDEIKEALVIGSDFFKTLLSVSVWLWLAKSAILLSFKSRIQVFLSVFIRFFLFRISGTNTQND